MFNQESRVLDPRKSQSIAFLLSTLDLSTYDVTMKRLELSFLRVYHLGDDLGDINGGFKQHWSCVQRCNAFLFSPFARPPKSRLHSVLHLEQFLIAKNWGKQSMTLLLRQTWHQSPLTENREPCSGSVNIYQQTGKALSNDTSNK
ncbi:hypothetical protein F2Q69_00032565 [Brassica cretica]|uniref:Uncharacterized protein n=1 Tax=Brassica cretica TaxID=69181 RepID=A0A8S9RZW2_BRACR|nr:hypothetical protein F2Q69_00032565 [Brassica cretica]